jgi:hypothetical protein
MNWNISETPLTSCRLDDQSSILAGAGINLLWTVSRTCPLGTTEVHLGKIYESEANLAPPASARAEIAWSISPIRLRDLLLKHITILLCSVLLWHCVGHYVVPNVGTIIMQDYTASFFRIDLPTIHNTNVRLLQNITYQPLCITLRFSITKW